MSSTTDDGTAASVKTTRPANDCLERHLLTGQMVRAMRLSLGVTVAELAQACSVSGPSIDATERGTSTTAAERHAIAAGFAGLLHTPMLS